MSIQPAETKGASKSASKSKTVTESWSVVATSFRLGSHVLVANVLIKDCEWVAREETGLNALL